MGLIVSFGLTIYAETLQENVAQNVLRLHVLAHSDAEADQALKLSVRDRILEESGEIFAACKTRAESEALFLKEKERLQKAAEDEIEVEILPPHDLNVEQLIEVYFDGIERVKLEVGDKVEVTKSEMTTTLIRISSASFLETLYEKMKER